MSTDKKTKRSNPVLTVIGIVLCICMAAILVVNCSLIIKSYTNKDQVPGIMGKVPLIVLTESMDPYIKGGDLIVCEVVKPEDIQVGDVIAFYDPAGNGKTIVTHRVMEITTGDDGKQYYITKGDANNDKDKRPVPSDKLVGRYTGTRIPKMGNIAMFMQTPAGLIVCVVCPLLLLVGYDILRRKRYEKSQKNDTDALMEELEALRAQKAEREKQTEVANESEPETKEGEDK